MDIFEAAKSVSILRIAEDIHGLQIRQVGNQMVACCPFHSDPDPSCTFYPDTNSFHCFGCEATGSPIDYVMKAGLATTPQDAASYIVQQWGLGSNVDGRTGTQNNKIGTQKGQNVSQKEQKSNENDKNVTPYTLADYAEDKHLEIDFLQGLGLSDKNGWLHIPYKLEDGSPGPIRYRQWQMFKWAKGSKLCLYGLDRLNQDNNEYVILVEGESDSQTLWYHGYPALGVPGARNFQTEWTRHLLRFEQVYLHKEPDEAGQLFVKRIAGMLKTANYDGQILVFSTPGHKDPNELHKYTEMPEAFRAALDAAIAGAHEPTPEELVEEKPGKAAAVNTVDEIILRCRENPADLFEEQIIGALAMMPVADQAKVKTALRGKINLRDFDQAVKDTRRKMKSQIRIAGPGSGPRLTDALPDCPLDAPVPGNWQMNGEGIFEAVTKQGEYGSSTNIERRFPVPIVLSAALTPLDSQDESCSYEVAWLNNGTWHRVAMDAAAIFDRARLTGAANFGLPVDSENSKGLLRWLAALRDTRGIPTKKVVIKCGWHGAAEKLFVLGPKIDRTGVSVDQSTSTQQKYTGKGVDSMQSTQSIGQSTQPEGLTSAGNCMDGNPDTSSGGKNEGVDEYTVDMVEWTPNLRGTEREMVNALSTRGDPEKQKELLLRVCKRFPLAGFLVGAGCAAPLLRLLRQNNRIDVDGFTVEVVSDQAGVGKSTGNEFAASVWGQPAMLTRTFDRTGLAWEVLRYTFCDLPIFLEETQLGKPEDREKIVYSQSLGMGRERGHRGGGLRSTRRFYNTQLVASEQSLKGIGSREGVEARVITLSPVFGRQTPERANDVREIRKQCGSHYGHAGRTYINYLVGQVNNDRWDEILQRFDEFEGCLEAKIPAEATGEFRSMAIRMASRVAACGLGLQLLMDALGVSVEDGGQVIPYNAMMAAWNKEILKNIDAAPLWKRALAIVQSWAAENAQKIAGMEPITNQVYGDKRIPDRYIGGIVDIRGVGECIGFLTNPFNDVIRKYLDVNGEEIQKAFVREGVCVPDKQQHSTRFQKSRSGVSGRMVCIPKQVIFPEAEVEKD